MSRFKNIKCENGQSVIFTVLTMIVFLAISGLVIDVGVVHVRSSVYQKAVDAAVLATCTKLPFPVSGENLNNKTECSSLLKEYLEKNGVSLEDDIVEIEFGDVKSGKYTSVKATVTTEVPYAFGPIIGLEGTNVTKSAKAMIQAFRTSTGMVPLGVEQSAFESAMSSSEDGVIGFTVKEDGGGGTGGFYGAIDLDGVKGGGAPDFEVWLAYGYGGEISVGDELPVESGNMAGPTFTGFSSRFNSCTHGGCTPENFVADCPRVVQLIVYNPSAKNKFINVAGFAPFILTGFNGNGEITASSINIKTQVGDPSDASDTLPGFGYYKISLVE
ncbi:MAG: hypothetical protein BWY11_00310 [Firmicutes bacterium ADurb.Bin182]|nr:MAG: hypothetical protein BWY11_00310 [Firmicutes bacterium ADurb.Bin182]